MEKDDSLPNENLLETDRLLDIEKSLQPNYSRFTVLPPPRTRAITPSMTRNAFICGGSLAATMALLVAVIYCFHVYISPSCDNSNSTSTDNHTGSDCHKQNTNYAMLLLALGILCTASAIPCAITAEDAIHYTRLRLTR